MRFDPGDEIWNKVKAQTDGATPGNMVYYQMCVAGNRLFIAGGITADGVAKNSLWVF